jgi:hypothetical protein
MKKLIYLVFFIHLISCKGKITPCFNKDEDKEFKDTKDFLCKGRWEETDYGDLYVEEYPIIKSCNFTDNGLARFHIKSEEEGNETISFCYRLTSDSTIEFTDKKDNTYESSIKKVNDDLIIISEAKKIFCIGCIYPAVPHYSMILKRK